MADFLYLLVFVASILITILFVIGTHEFAHFAVARLVGVKVLRFSIGFGKTLWRRYDRSGTEYVFALVPLGGYVKMLGESDDQVPEHEKHMAFSQQPYYKKFLIVLAGPAMNLLCAFVLYWIIFTMGFVTIKPVIGQITPNSIASNAGMQANTEIVSVDFDKVDSWTGVMFRLLTHIGNHDKLAIATSPINNTQKTLHLLNLADWKMGGLTPDPLSSLGMTPYEPPMPLIIGFIGENTPAAHSPLKIGDKLISINNQPIVDWPTLTHIVKANPGKDMTFTVKRANRTIKLSVHIGVEHSWLLKKSGYLGLGPYVDFPPEMLRKVKYSPLAAIPHAYREVSDFTYFNLVLFAKLFTGKMSLQALGGPITIFESAGKALNYGILPFLGFLAFLSASVGVINLIPIPGLDGGHLLFQTIEAIIRHPLPQRLLAGLYYMGFAFIMFILIQALMNDVLRLT